MELGIRHRHSRHELGDVRCLGGFGLQELQPRRQVPQQIDDLDSGSDRGTDLGHRAHARVDRDPRRREVVGAPRRQGHP